MLTEKYVQAVWYDAAIRPVELTTDRGELVRVLSPGDWNLEAGPDFRNAVLEVGPKRLAGDVEVHVCPNDWDIHGHGTDPNYHNVVAHVTWKAGARPKTLPPNAISIWLGRCFTKPQIDGLSAIDITAYPYSQFSKHPLPCEKQLSHDPTRARDLLTQAGRDRIRMKSDRLHGRLCERRGNRRQVFYEEMLGAMGYKQNAEPFRRVAERVPLANLPHDIEMAKQALLIASSFESWQRNSSRPNNSPERRLAKMAELFADPERVAELMSISDFSRKNCQRIMTTLCQGGCMGKGRAAAVMVNVLVPLAHAEGRIRDIPEWLPAEDISSPVRLMAARMFGRDHNPGEYYADNGVLVQGLLWAKMAWCARGHPACAGNGVSAALVAHDGKGVGLMSRC